MRAAGHEVIGTDLVDYGRPDCFWRRDFLFERKVPDGCEAIITNPPFKLAEQFVEHALELSPLVVMLLRFAFFESESAARSSKTAGWRESSVFASDFR